MLTTTFHSVLSLPPAILVRNKQRHVKAAMMTYCQTPFSICFDASVTLLTRSSILYARSQEDLIIRAEISGISALELDRSPSPVARCCLARVCLSRDITRWTTLTQILFIEVHDAAWERILWYAVDGKVHAAGSAFGVWESDTARFVVLVGSIVRQVAELVRRSYQTIDCRRIAGTQQQVGCVGALAVREGVQICVWHFGLACWRCSRHRGCRHGDDACRKCWGDCGRGCIGYRGRGCQGSSCPGRGADGSTGDGDNSWAVGWPDATSRTDLVIGNLTLAWRWVDCTDWSLLGVHQYRHGCQQCGDDTFRLQQ
jgi:hypothetical protein